MDLTIEARQFLRSSHQGILSTHCVKFAGYPFGSVTPFVLDHNCQPVILISDLAEHTKNIASNAKVSLLVFDNNDDLQANARLTLLGTAEKIKKDDANLQARYCRYLPQSAAYFDMHDFSFYRIHITQARYIAGFGKMGWMEGNALNQSISNDQAQVIAELETGMIAHMNADHQTSLIAYCQHFYRVLPNSVDLIGVDSEGFDVKADLNDGAKILRFNFITPIFDANSARAAFVAMSKLCAHE